MPSWTDPVFLAEAHRWIRQRVEELGGSLNGAVEQPHVRLWSTVMRVPTTLGDLWFKANLPGLANEAGIVRVLSARCPSGVTEQLAADVDRDWMLMAGGGERLREIIEREHSLARYVNVLPLYASVQIEVAGCADEFVRLGAPDRRLAVLPQQYQELLDQVTGLPGEERDHLKGLQADVAEMCLRLAAYGIPETIQHDDFHDGQVFVRDGAYRIIDWADACVSHPFFSMAVALEGVVSFGLDDIEGSERIEPYRDAYLQPFAGRASRAELLEAHAIALRLGWICKALNQLRFANVVGRTHRVAELERIGVYLRMFLGGLTRSA